MMIISNSPVRAWEETITLPTYPPPPPDPNPMFLEKRINQGTSGKVYPNPFTDHVHNDPERKVDRSYRAVFLENEYLQLMLLPEIGGRVHAALDKTNGYDFIYRQHVVKPALIGLFGSWISGGIEWNWPMHHRPSTFMPVDHFIEAHPDGSRTVWLSEHDPMWRMKGMVGLCLYPGKAYFEAKVRLYNRTPVPQRFLWWANVAVHANENYQIVFPPDVTYITFHARADMAHYPVARTVFCGIDFTQGVDISWWKNIGFPISFFVLETQYDHFGGYDHGRQAGIVHVANRFVAPGKKMFTWGNGEFGRAWDRNLTDGDGPYIELMAGAYTDNQPDFSWLQPYETKVFSQFWYPIQKIGPAKNANLYAAVNLEVIGNTARFGVCSPQVFPGAVIRLECAVSDGAGSVGNAALQTEVLFEQRMDLAPGAPFVGEIVLPEGVLETDLLLRVYTAEGQELIRYRPERPVEKRLPPPFTPLSQPTEIPTNEELYLAGLHLDQYVHPTWAPEPYWEEALRRDPGDARCNNALGLSHLRRGRFAEAEAHFRRAVATLTRLNPNPHDGEPVYNLGLALKYQSRLDEAYAAFYKAIWSHAWQAAGYYALAEIDCLRGDLFTALEHLDRSFQRDTRSLKTRDLTTAVLRRLGRLEKAEALCRETLALDPLDFWARNEWKLLVEARGGMSAPERSVTGRPGSERPGDPQTCLDVAFDYANAGLWQEASDLLTFTPSPGPIVLYTLGYFAARQGDEAQARETYRRAAAASPDFCFPFRLEEMLVLQAAMEANPADPRAPYYLGNLLYDKNRYDEAIALWERAAELDPGFAIPWRNLGIAYYNVRKDPEKAQACYQKAFVANPGDGRLLYELDQLQKRLRVPPAERLARLERHLDLVASRDDLTIERVALLNQLGRPQEALDLLLSRRFFPWEGGEGIVSGQYAAAGRLLGRTALEAGDTAGALAHFEAAQVYPENLGEGKRWWVGETDLHYYAGLARELLGDAGGAREWFQKAAEYRGQFDPMAYYRALALRKLGQEQAAKEALRQLLDHAAEQLRTELRYGYFYTSLATFALFEDDLQTVNRVHNGYLIGLAHLGLGQHEEAKRAFSEVLALDPNHLGAQEELKRLL